jgi:hypothetical protein
MVLGPLHRISPGRPLAESRQSRVAKGYFDAIIRRSGDLNCDRPESPLVFDQHATQHGVDASPQSRVIANHRDALWPLDWQEQEEIERGDCRLDVWYPRSGPVSRTVAHREVRQVVSRRSIEQYVDAISARVVEIGKRSFEHCLKVIGIWCRGEDMALRR